LHLNRKMVGNQMILESEIVKNEDDKPFHHRITWKKMTNSNVRQYIGHYCQYRWVAFDGLCKKKY